MKAKPLVPSAAARNDVSEAVRYYAHEAGAEIAEAFVAELEIVNAKIAATPSIGSPGCASDLKIPGLRDFKLRRFPYLVFYIERSDHIEVWRALHNARDMAGWLAGDDE